MASTPVTPIVVPELLSYKNYEEWSLRVQTYLMAEKLWDFVEPSTGEASPQPKPEDGEEYKDWKRDNAKALYVIQNSCGSDMFSVISTTFTAKDAWEALELDCKAKQKAQKDVEEFEPYILFTDYVFRGEWEKAEKCLKELPDAVRMRDPRDEYGDTALHLAANQGHLQTVKWLMSVMRKEDIQSKNAHGNTALYEAVTQGHLEIVKVLVPVMGKVEFLFGDTTLHFALRHGQVHIVKELMLLMTQEDLQLKNERGSTILHMATVLDYLDIVKELVSVMGEIQNNNGNTALHLAVMESNARIVKQLVKSMKRKDLEIRDENGSTALDLALKKENVPILKELVYNDDHFDRYIKFTNCVSKGDWENAKECLGESESYVQDALRARDPRDKDENTALHVAAKHGHANIIKELVLLTRQKSTEDTEGKAYSVCEETTFRKAKYLIEQKECVLEQRNAIGETALHLAVSKGNVHAVKELVKFMSNEGFEIKDEAGSTALHRAISIEKPMNVDIVKELVPHMKKESFEVKDGEGYTALQRVVLKGNFEIVKFLVPFMRVEGYEVKDNTTGYTALHQAVVDGNEDIVKQLVSCMRQEGLNVRDANGSHALHCAVKAKKMNISIVKELVCAMSSEALEIKNDKGYTALGYALKKQHDEDKDVKEIASHMSKKNANVFAIEMPDFGDLPVVYAGRYGKVELGHYLYSLTPTEVLNNWNGSYLIGICIKRMNNLDIALDLLQRNPRLAVQTPIGDDKGDYCPMLVLARMDYAFLSGSRLTLWQKWIYKSINAQPPAEFNTSDTCIDVPKSDGRSIFSVTRFISGCVKFLRKHLGIDYVYKMKSTHLQVEKFLDCFRKVHDIKDLSEAEATWMDESIIKAIQRGHVEFVEHMVDAQDQFKRSFGEEDKTLYHLAVEHRQESIYNLIYRLNQEKRNSIGTDVAKGTNYILHVAGKPSLMGSKRLNRFQGASLQMQRELQWFKEVESIVPIHVREAINRTDRLTGRDLFTENHNKLMEEAEKSIKATASACTVVGSLIATMIFAAAFTVPGGNNGDTGIPVFVDKHLFLAFIVSDTLSLVSSTTSVIIFLGLLTSRYAEDDYLTSLPNKMMLGLFTLFISIATMMIAFSYALIIMLREEYSWIITPTIILGSVPILSFVWVQFPLLYKTFMSTYGPGIFGKEARRPWYKTLMKAVVSCLGFSKSQPKESMHEAD